MSKYASLIASTVMTVLFLPFWLLGFFVFIEDTIFGRFSAEGLALLAITFPVVAFPTLYVALFIINGRNNRSFSDHHNAQD